jgi:hypothetical protein
VNPTGNGQHAFGTHNYNAGWLSSCNFTDTSLSCGTNCFKCMGHLVMNYSAQLPTEWGYTPGYYHAATSSGNSGWNSGGVGPLTGQAAVSGAVNSCLTPYCIQISITWQGIQATYTPPSTFWTAPEVSNWGCPALTITRQSPIVIDRSGRNFTEAFTSADDGVTFKWGAYKREVKTAWTNPHNPDIGFLVYDRNHNGVIDDSSELFGNYTRQPPYHIEDGPADPNGFLALSVFDKPDKGGNGDGVIDSKDAIWSELRVWVDTSHTGDSRQGKLYTMEEFGVNAISLRYVPSKRTDQYGNEMRYQGVIEAKPGSRIPYIYDVYFVQ